MIKLNSAKIYDFTQADYAKMYSLLDCAIKEKIDKKKLILYSEIMKPKYKEE